QLQRGDLLGWSRGQPGSKLGHVSRIDVPPASNGDIVTVGGNENNVWTRRTRNISEHELEGAIKYRDYRRIDFDEKRPAQRANPVQRVSIVQPSAPAPRAPEQASSSFDERIDRILTVDGWMRFEEDYLPRVVTGENGHAHLEALKAQAVASRTYVLRAMRDDRSIGRSSPVPNSQKFQVYSRGAFPQCIAAVEATRGEVGRYEGRLIIANYVAGAIWSNGRPGNDPTNTEKWVTYNMGRTGKSVLPTKLSHTGRSDNRGCMSQNGADALARTGRTYKDILRFFYGNDLEIGSGTNQPKKEGAVIMVPAMQVQNVMPRRQAAPNAYATRSNIVMPRNGIEALAASNGRMPKPAARTNVAGAPRIAVGGDPLQTELEAARIEIDGLNTKMDSAGHPFGDQWGLYVQSFNAFFQRNYALTADRQPEAMQTAFKYREGIRQWAYVLAARMAQTKSTTVEGATHSDGFPVLPTLGLVAVVGAAAVMIAMTAK
ncbi:MAG TPA: SpoIID/LytB domain-containing protein, partial [Polyangium sp.]|nr:SpoIID/LytB domain-containing protein [Polyangium sp.]